MSASYVDREKQIRSVFVGNIPFDVTESELREKFEQAGPIVSFRLVHDRDSGKPKGYGFIEYQDAATANSCVRNLNNVEYNGRPLRVGPAAGGDQSSAENIKALQQALGGLQQESPYGPPVEPTEAPEAISKAVSSLPPEQMFELMKQMKLCIQNNPNEARSMLLQNPQLAYALLQAQIVMKIVDPQVAMALLHRERDPTAPLANEEPPKPVAPVPVSNNTGSYRPSGGLLGERPSDSSAPSSGRSGLLDSSLLSPTNAPDRWGGGGPNNPPVMDPRNSSMRGSDASMNHHGLDPRGGPSGMDPRGVTLGMDSRGSAAGMDSRSSGRGLDPRSGPAGMDPRGLTSGMDSRGGPPGLDPRGSHPGMDPRGAPPTMDPRRDPRTHPSMDSRGPMMDRRDPGTRSQDIDFRNVERGRHSGGDYGRGGLLDPPRDVRQASGPSRGAPSSSQFSPRQGGSSGPPASAGADEDKEKAALIMQVLQLTDEQIQQLPPDQRQSILILKQQISRQQ